MTLPTTNPETSLKVDWTKPVSEPDVTYYIVEYKKSSDSTWTVTGNLGVWNPSYTITGLDKATEYDVRVKARNSNGSDDIGPVSDTTSAYTGGFRLSLDTTSVDEDGGAKSIKVSLTDNGHTYDPAPTITVTVGKSGDTATSGTDYTAVSSFTLTPFSTKEHTFTFTPTNDALYETDETVTGSATGHTVFDAGFTLDSEDTWGGPAVTLSRNTAQPTKAICVSWTNHASHGTATGYDVEYRQQGAARWIVHSLRSNTATGATIDGLQPKTTYQVRVKATNNKSEGSDWTETTHATDDRQPWPVTPLGVEIQPKIYYSTWNAIKSVNLDGTNVSMIYEQTSGTAGSNPMGLALDEDGDTLYIANPNYDGAIGARISKVPALTSSSTATNVISGGGNPPHRPRYMVIEHTTGKMFWSDFGKTAIYSANTDSTEKTALISDSYIGIGFGIAVDRRNNSKPKFPATSISVPENTTAVSSVIATDDESPRDSVTCSIEGGADKDKFTLNASTCKLDFTTAPDFETPTDADKQNTYVIILKATSSAGYWTLSSANTTITVPLSPGTAYKVEVAAGNDEGWTDYSPVGTLSTRAQAAQPKPPDEDGSGESSGGIQLTEMSSSSAPVVSLFIGREQTATQEPLAAAAPDGDGDASNTDEREFDYGMAAGEDSGRTGGLSLGYGFPLWLLLGVALLVPLLLIATWRRRKRELLY